MIGKQRAFLIGSAAFALSGCAAALIPVAAGGVMGGGRLHHHRQPAMSRSGVATNTQEDPPASDPPMIASVPNDPSTMTVGQAYRGNLPPPTGSVAASGSPPVPPRPVVPGEAAGSGGSGWTDMLHFVAAAALHRPVVSVLPADGTTGMPHWLPCGDKPAAVLVALPPPGTSMLAEPAAGMLSAIETMGVDLLFFSDQPAPVVARQLAELAAAGVTAPVADRQLFTGDKSRAPATRARIGARYCIVAIVGSRAADFPNAPSSSATGAPPGWFMIR